MRHKGKVQGRGNQDFHAGARSQLLPSSFNHCGGFNDVGIRRLTSTYSIPNQTTHLYEFPCLSCLSSLISAKEDAFIAKNLRKRLSMTILHSKMRFFQSSPVKPSHTLFKPIQAFFPKPLCPPMRRSNTRPSHSCFRDSRPISPRCGLLSAHSRPCKKPLLPQSRLLAKSFVMFQSSPVQSPHGKRPAGGANGSDSCLCIVNPLA